MAQYARAISRLQMRAMPILTRSPARHTLLIAVQAAPGPAGRVEPTCRDQGNLSLCAAGVAGRRRCARRSPVNRLPDRSNLDHLKKQAKDLIHAYRARDPDAIGQFRAALPAASGRS